MGMFTTRPTQAVQQNAAAAVSAAANPLPAEHPAGQPNYPWQWIVVGVVALYFLLAAIQRKHMQEEIRFHNILVNVHNFLVIGISAWIFFILAKIAVVKMAIANNQYVSKVGNFFKYLLPSA